MKLPYAAQTDIGKVRTRNEDNLTVDEDLSLYIVCDGMGGHTCGDLASKMAVNLLKDYIKSHKDVINKYIANIKFADKKEIFNILNDAIIDTNDQIFEESLRLPDHRGMGTTLSLLLVTGCHAYIAQVGDSRIYLLRDQSIYQITEDHSLFFELVKHGKFGYRTMSKFPYKNVVTRALGAHDTIEVDFFSLDILPNDRFILCSDGLHNYAEDSMLLSIGLGSDLKKAANQLVSFANDKGGADNITVIMLQIPREADIEDAEEVRLHLKIFSQLPLFSALSYTELLRLMNVAERRDFKENEIIFQEGEEGDGLYILLSGKVQIMRGDMPIVVYEKGCHFGEMSLVESATRLAKAKAAADSKILIIKRRDFFRLLRNAPYLAVKLLWNLVNILTSRLKATNDELIVLKTYYNSDQQIPPVPGDSNIFGIGEKKKK
jgi:serine/threonine protein phosphatase PrpC